MICTKSTTNKLLLLLNINQQLYKKNSKNMCLLRSLNGNICCVQDVRIIALRLAFAININDAQQ